MYLITYIQRKRERERDWKGYAIPATEFIGSLRDEVFHCDLLPVLPSQFDNFPAPSPVVVDIGAGLAMYDIPLHHYYRHRAHLHILDKSVNEVGWFKIISWFGGFIVSLQQCIENPKLSRLKILNPDPRRCVVDISGES